MLVIKKYRFHAVKASHTLTLLSKCLTSLKEARTARFLWDKLEVVAVKGEEEWRPAEALPNRKSGRPIFYGKAVETRRPQ